MYQAPISLHNPHLLLLLQLFVVVRYYHAFGKHCFGCGYKVLCNLHLLGIGSGGTSEGKDGVEWCVAGESWMRDEVGWLLRWWKLRWEKQIQTAHFLSGYVHCSTIQGHLITKLHDWLGIVRIKDPLKCRSQRLPMFTQLFSLAF